MIVTRWMCLVRGVIFRAYVLMFGGSVGRRIMVDRGVTLRSLPHKGIKIGSGVYLGRGVVLDIPRTASLTVGNDALIAHYCVIAASESITIGRGAQIAEHCSIRDADHGMRPGVEVRLQPLSTTPVDVGDDVWIGRGSAVLRGSRIEDGAIVGANSVVKGSIPRGTVVAGSPARHIRDR